jgi:hypothetical protein
MKWEKKKVIILIAALILMFLLIKPIYIQSIVINITKSLPIFWSAFCYVGNNKIITRYIYQRIYNIVITLHYSD